MAPAEDSSLQAALGRTRQSYDETPYVSAPMMRSHPGRLAAQALWRGLAAPEAARARVLEIGCASGGNLLPMAAGMPDARFLGVDLSPKQIAAGEARRARLGLANVELRAASFETLSEADGAFDFIICHGVYSWIPEGLRGALLRVIQARLAPHGVAMVSFNVLPGWRLFQIARDAMLLHARMADPAQRAENTRDLFRLLAAQSETLHSYGKFWRDEATLMTSGGDAYLAHEIFEESNAPVAFADFADRAAGAGLDYLGESVMVANSADDLAPEAAESIRRLAGDDRLKRETYIDIFSGRTFREALLVHRGRAQTLAEAPGIPTLAALHYIPALDLELAEARDRPGVYRLNVKQTEIDIEDEAAGPPLRRLLQHRPASSTPAELVTSQSEAAAMAELLPLAVELGFLAVSTLPVGCAARLPERPQLWPLAALDAETGEATTTLRHSAFQFAPMQRLLAPLIDGTRTRGDLVAAAEAAAANGALTVGGAGDLRQRLEDGVDQALAGFLRAGLLVAGR